jgi:hypothetical protein
MGNSQAGNYKSVLETVRGWSPRKRVSLVQDILATLAPELEKPAGSTLASEEGRGTLQEALGLLSSGGPVPSDEEVQKWLDEYR